MTAHVVPPARVGPRRRVCVIGAGVGALVAITLGESGVDVTLVDERPAILGGASAAQLARLHLGHHYSGDDRFVTGRSNTAQRCTLGTLAWLRRYPEAAPTPGRWWQLITTDSMTTTEDYLRFCRRLGDFHAALAEADPLANEILAGPTPSFRSLAPSEYAGLVAPRRVVLGAETTERIIDVDALRQSIGRDLRSTPTIDVRLGTRVTAIRRTTGGGYTVALGDREHLEVDAVVNASWHDLTSLTDEGGPPNPMTTRLRFVASADLAGPLLDAPSMFFHRGVLGSHTRIGAGSIRFVSEPVCNFASRAGVGVPEPWRALMLDPLDSAHWVDAIRAASELGDAEGAVAGRAPVLDRLRDRPTDVASSGRPDAGRRVHDHIAAAIVDGYAELVPAIRHCGNVRVTPTVSVDVGRTDVWRPTGPVHRRDWVVDAHAPGLVHVNPGKFTFGVLAADEAVARVAAHLDGRSADSSGCHETTVDLVEAAHAESPSTR